jgi:hypothetical protein
MCITVHVFSRSTTICLTKQEDMQARLRGLGTNNVSEDNDTNDDQDGKGGAPSSGPPPSDYDSLMSRFNSLKN